MAFQRTQNVTVLAASGAALTHTGDTNKTTKATIPIPAGAMGLNGILRVTMHVTMTNNANAKTPFVDLGATSFCGPAYTSTASARFQAQISNKNSAASQSSYTAGNTVSWGGAGGASVSGTENTATALNLTLGVTLANGTDSFVIESYLVELILP